MINTFENVEIPSNDTLAIDAPKKLKIISKPNSLRVALNKIKRNMCVKNQKVD